MAYIATLNQYIRYTEHEYKNAQGNEVARMLSLQDNHIFNKNLSSSSNITVLVGGNCVSPLDEIIIAHLLCVKALVVQNYKAAFNRQSDCVACVVKVLQAQKDVNWGLPIMYAVCLDLRLVAQRADALTSTPKTSGKILEKAAESLMTCFRVCTSDKVSNFNTKKLGMLNIVNQLMKIYHRIDKIELCKPLMRAIDFSPIKDKFSTLQMVTYKFFVGRIAVYESQYRSADEALTFAFNKCPNFSFKNKRQILTYLVPVKMLLGLMPAKHVLEKYDLMLFWDLASAVKAGKLKLFDDLMNEHDSFFKKAGILLSVEKLKIIARRNLFRKVCMNEQKYGEDKTKAYQIDLKKFQAALHMMGDTESDIDDTQCMVAHMIYHNIIKGYISHQHQVLVISKKNAFPKLSTSEITHLIN